MDWFEVQNSLSNTVFAFLMISMLSYWINLAFFDGKSLLSIISQVTSIMATASLVFSLGLRWITEGYFPLSNLYESLLFLTCALLLVCFYFEIKTKKKLIGTILVPVALLISGFANLTLSPEMQKSSPLVPALQSNWLMLHVSMMLLSYATLIMGSLLCILFLVISRGNDIDLKRDVEDELIVNCAFLKYMEYSKGKDEVYEFILGQTYKLLKILLLQFIDNWSYRIIGLGFPFLTMGIVSGAVWANEAWGSYWSWDPKEVWALITWLVFTCYLHARYSKGWEGKNAATLGGLGFFAIWICYLGVNFLGKGLHSYGWFS